MAHATLGRGISPGGGGGHLFQLYHLLATLDNSLNLSRNQIPHLGVTGVDEVLLKVPSSFKVVGFKLHLIPF